MKNINHFNFHRRNKPNYIMWYFKINKLLIISKTKNYPAHGAGTHTCYLTNRVSQDVWIWTSNPEEGFTVKCRYNLMLEDQMEIESIMCYCVHCRIILCMFSHTEVARIGGISSWSRSDTFYTIWRFFPR